jgi:hypothetical protein
VTGPRTPDPDTQAAALRRLESRVAQLEDSVQVYGPPDNRPLFTLYVPRLPTLTKRQTTFVLYSLFFLSVGLYTYAKFKAGEQLA